MNGGIVARGPQRRGPLHAIVYAGRETLFSVETPGCASLSRTLTSVQARTPLFSPRSPGSPTVDCDRFMERASRECPTCAAADGPVCSKSEYIFSASSSGVRRNRREAVDRARNSHWLTIGGGASAAGILQPIKRLSQRAQRYGESFRKR